MTIRLSPDLQLDGAAAEAPRAVVPVIERRRAPAPSAATASTPRAPVHDWSVDARLADAAESGAVVEVVVVLRGTVHPWDGHTRGLWRLRLRDGHYRVFSAQSLVALTPVKPDGSPTPYRDVLPPAGPRPER